MLVQDMLGAGLISAHYSTALFNCATDGIMLLCHALCRQYNDARSGSPLPMGGRPPLANGNYNPYARPPMQEKQAPQPIQVSHVCFPFRPAIPFSRSHVF